MIEDWIGHLLIFILRVIFLEMSKDLHGGALDWLVLITRHNAKVVSQSEAGLDKDAPVSCFLQVID